MKLSIAKWIYKNLAQDKDECTVPGDWLKHEFGELDDKKPIYVAHTSNDGHEIWIAYNNGGKWLVYFDQKTARDLAWFILWNWWGKSTWFGLRRKLWYWALHTKLMSQLWYRKRYGNR
jgi:hypothetical protein